MNKTREEVRSLVKGLRDLTANQPSLPAIYPDYEAPIVRLENGERLAIDGVDHKRSHFQTEASIDHVLPHHCLWGSLSLHIHYDISARA